MRASPMVAFLASLTCVVSSTHAHAQWVEVNKCTLTCGATFARMDIFTHVSSAGYSERCRDGRAGGREGGETTGDAAAVALAGCSHHQHWPTLHAPPHTVKLPDKCYNNFIAIYVKGVMDAPECMACPGTFIKPAQAVAKAVKVKPACSG